MLGGSSADRLSASAAVDVFLDALRVSYSTFRRWWGHGSCIPIWIL